MALSPDDRFVATVKHDYLTGQFRVWLAALPTGQFEPFSDSDHASTILWSQDGSTLFYREDRKLQLLRRTVSPKGAEEPQSEIGRHAFPSSMAPDPRYAAGELSNDADHSEVAWLDFRDGKWHSLGASGKRGLLPHLFPRWKMVGLRFQPDRQSRGLSH